MSGAKITASSCTLFPGRAAGWMFFGLVASYAAEFILLFLGRSAARPWLPLACYFPLVPVWLWRRFYV